MKLEVIGYKGVVGSATYELFKRIGWEVTGSDKGDEIGHADVYFICVPEDVVQKPVEEIYHWVRRGRRENFLVVVRSSVTPGTCASLGRVFAPLHICHNPEFLREAIALQDEFSPDRIVIGQCCPAHGLILEHLYKPLQRPIIKIDPTTSELVKLASNCYLSTVISYWNTIEQIAGKLKVSGTEVGMVASMDHRISEYGARFHNKYGGRCLPKDMMQLIEFSEVLGVDPVLLKAVEEVNNSL